MAKSSKIAGTLFFLIFFISLFIQDGTLGSVDVVKRYWVAHSAWTGEAPVDPVDIPQKQVLVGVDGSVHYWYGMGQGIFMVPGDIISTNLLKALHLDEQAVVDYLPTLQTIIIAAITFPGFSAGAVAIAFLFLIELNFSLYISLLGSLSLFFGTTLLNYTQEHQENSQILFLTLCGYYLIFKWVKYRRLLFLALGFALAGSMILIRVTTLADSAGVMLFGLLSLFWYKPDPDGKEAPVSRSITGLILDQKSRLITFLLTAVPGFGFFLVLDRLYQFKRFGSWTSNYLQVFADQAHAGIFDPFPIYHLQPSALPPDWPWNMSRITAIVNVLFSPEKSLFIYDPLLLVMALVALVSRFKLADNQVLTPRLAFTIGGLVSLVLYLGLYSNIIFWGGDVSWAARYYTTPVEVICLLAVPVFLEKKASFPNWAKITGKGLISIALAVQFLSALCWNMLEVSQQECGIGSSFRLGQRILNIWYIATGSLPSSPGCTLGFGPHINTFNFTAFVGFDMPPTIRLVFVVLWAFVLGYFLFALYKFVRRVRKNSALNPA